MTFYKFYLEQNRKKDIENQKSCVSAAKHIKECLIHNSEISNKYKWLYDKVVKNIQDGYRGLSVEKNVIEVLDEIINPNNLSSKLHWSKSPRKQKIEEIQREYILSKYNIKILAGKNFGVCPSGKDSYRFIYETLEFVKGFGKKEGITTKSMDGILENKNLKTEHRYWIFQKVTTDDGGSTNSVEEEVIKTIDVANKHIYKFGGNTDIFIFLLDGPYWERKQYKKDDKNRFEKIFEMSSENVIVCNSDTIITELKIRNMI